MERRSTAIESEVEAFYKTVICSIFTYDSESWVLDEHTCKVLNGVNTTMLSFFTNKSVQEK